MRKDVKFGLTVGAILLATLAVYVIVLSRGGMGSPSNPDVASAPPSATGDATPAPNTASPTPATPTDQTIGDAPNVPGSATDTAPATDKPATPPIPLDSNPPATEPSASANSTTDWNYELNHGQVKTLAAAAPERTETPTIDRNAVAVNEPNVVSADAHPALIDGPAAREPAPLAAPAIEPAIAQANTPAIAAPQQPTVDPAPVPTAGGPRTHIVVHGETLSSIANAIYGNSKYYTKIEMANPGIDARHLKIGAKLVIPDLTDTDRSASSAPASSASAPAVDPAKGYTVVAGDTLEKISVKLYGNAEMVEKIYDLNRGRIGPDENRLSIGWVLKLPQAPSNTTSVTAASH